MGKTCKNALAVTALLSAVFLSAGCEGKPDNLMPVENFDINKYAGTWYEIARFDFFFEKNVNKVTAEYTLNDDGTVKVINRGYNYKKGKFQQAEGKARFRDEKTRGALEVSFFGPFYGDYNVIAIDSEYTYALVAGSSYKYLWILSRTPSVPDNIRAEYTALAESLGFNVKKLVWTEH